MRPAGLWRAFVSARMTVTLLCSLALLLLLLIVVPQASVLGEGPFQVLAAASSVNRFLLVSLGLGRLPTSPIFVVVLALFFVNLGAVLLARLGPTWRRIQLRPPSGRGVEAWARLEESRSGALPAGWSAGHAAEILRGFGYQVRRPAEQALWGVKHRLAPLGFLLFHLSFFLICAGGVLIYYTRFQGTVFLSEGQTFNGSFNSVERRPPLGGVPDLSFTLQQVDPRMERGEPVHLAATFRIRSGGAGVTAAARVNDPARWGIVSLLVTQAGLAPALWLQDSRGFTLDRVVVPVRGSAGLPTELPLGGGRWKARLHPLPAGAEFPEREALQRTAIRVEVRPPGEPDAVFDGRLGPGASASLGEDRLVLEEMRYWVGVRLVSERGGGLLSAGFLLAVVGVTWRLLLYRRELALTWDEAGLRLVGRSEYFSWRFQRELDEIRDMLSAGAASSRPAAAPPSDADATRGAEG